MTKILGSVGRHTCNPLVAIVLILMLVGLITVLLFAPLPGENKDPVMLLLGAVTGVTTVILPKLLGVDVDKHVFLKAEITKLKTELGATKEAYAFLVHAFIKKFFENHEDFDITTFPELFAKGFKDLEERK